MNRFACAVIAAMTIWTTTALAADANGLDALSLETGVIAISDIQKQYDAEQPQRAIAFSATTLATQKVISHYVHSQLLAQGWQNNSVIAAQGGRMIRDNEEITFVSQADTASGRTKITLYLTNTDMQAEGAPQ